MNATMTANRAAQVLASWATRIARHGWSLVVNESADTNRRLGISDGSRTVYAADWLWAGADARSVMGLRKILTARVGGL